MYCVFDQTAVIREVERMIDAAALNCCGFLNFGSMNVWKVPVSRSVGDTRAAICTAE